ncbi:MAG: hypothetical protein K1Y01_14465 [Vicinamibacteria bacterium]|nr:hypothetical protein [Vicinamibacteria bacterium]
MTRTVAIAVAPGFEHDGYMMITGLAVGLLLEAAALQARPADAVRLIRAEVGPSGATKGSTFVLNEKRESFDLATDKEVIVAFEWDGPPATHRCELSWIAPDGTVALKAVLDLAAKGRRFSGFWSLLLNPTMARGLWAAEVKVDGSPGGSRTFRITGPPLLKELPTDELYRLASEATLRLEAQLPPGAERRFFSGFAIGDDAVITTFEAINAAMSVQILFPDGTRVETDEAWKFSREFDWVLLKAAVPLTHKRLKHADGVKVGDRCLFLNVIEGQREMAACSIVGQNNSAGAPRWSISHRPSQAAFGAPLLNSFGDVIGLVGADSQAGGGAFEDASGATAFRIGSRSSSSGLLVVPTKDIKRPEGADPALKFVSFWERGLFYKPITASKHVGYGTLAVGPADPRGVGARSTGGGEFYAKDGTLTALVSWEPREKLDTTMNYVCYDMMNRRIVLGKPLKISMRPGTRIDSSSQLDVSAFSPGEYRLDIMLGDDVAWRTYFKIKP